MRIRLPGHHAHGHHAHGDHAASDHAHSHGVQSFEGTAARYDRMTRYLMRRPYRRIAADAVAGLPPGGSVLDVGTGPGRLLVEVLRLRPDLRVTGVDLAADMVETANRNLAGFADRAVAVVADVRDLPFENDTFDLIVSTLSLHHWAEPEACGAELSRTLRPGGQVRIYDLRSAPFAALRDGFIGRPGPVEPLAPPRFAITPLPRPALRLLVLPSV
jgi:ubiquinone/menaquinone biosynthesis C-methylase UbiE